MSDLLPVSESGDHAISGHATELFSLNTCQEYRKSEGYDDKSGLTEDGFRRCQMQILSCILGSEAIFGS